MNQRVLLPQSTSLQRARGQLDLSVRCDANAQTRLVNLREEGSLRAIFPRTPNQSVEAVILNTAGGIAGGDHFNITAQAFENADLSITTQAAERIYKAMDHTPGRLHTKIDVAANARCNWLPQETILFDGAQLHRRLDVDLSETATFLMVEPLIFGREASGETIRNGLFYDRVRITRDELPIYLDGVHLSGDMAATLQPKAIADGARAMANVVFYQRDAARSLSGLRDLLPVTAGASLLNDTTLVARILAPDSYELRKILLPIMTLLTDNAVPKNWRL